MKSFSYPIVLAIILLSFCQLVGIERTQATKAEAGYATGWAENPTEESESLEMEDDDAFIDWKPSIFPKANKNMLALRGHHAQMEFLREVILPPPQGIFLA